MKQGTVSLAGAYTPAAIYYELSDSLEYLRRDEPVVYRRVDDRLTLAMDLAREHVVGFRLKGFNNFYLRRLKPLCDTLGVNFTELTLVLEHMVGAAADQAFNDDEQRQQAYREAYTIAREDKPKLVYPAAA